MIAVGKSAARAETESTVIPCGDPIAGNHTA